MSRELTDVVIDRGKWRCGGWKGLDPVLGETRLLGEEGFRCCLGFACSARGVADDDLAGRWMPTDTGKSIKGLSYRGTDTKVSDCAVDINDDHECTVSDREESVKRVLSKAGFNVIFEGEYDPRYIKVMEDRGLNK